MHQPCQQRPLYFGHGEPSPERASVYAEFEALELPPTVTPPRARPVSRDDDLGFDRSQVSFMLRHMS